VGVEEIASNLKELVKKNKKYQKEDFGLNEMLDKFLLFEQNKKADWFTPAFHPSLISKGVDCQIWWYYFLKNSDAQAEKWSDENLTAMAIGKAIHDETQHILYRMGILEGVYQCVCCGHKFWATAPKECPECNQVFKSWKYVIFKEVPIHTGLVRGHADGFVNQDGVRFLLELKSIKNADRPNATYGYERLLAKPMDDHFIQTQIYLNCWYEIAKKAPIGEEFVVDDTGRVSTEKLEGPVYDGAKLVGVCNQGLVEYVAKNSSEKKAYVVKRNSASIQFLLDEMRLIYKAYLEDNLDSLTGIDYTTNKGKCKKCAYRGLCSWES
jgi:rubrerythrin/CRISPR/Cas system-associated exonuclease Cas4 (RecB family)